MMRKLGLVAVVGSMLSFSACGSVTAVGGGDPGPGAPQEAPKPADDKKAEAEKKAEEIAQKEKDLQQKQRDLDYAKIGVQTTAIDRQVRTMSVDNAVARATLELEKQRKELDLFLNQHKPRELEEHRIQLDWQTYRAEESKDELAELENMYKGDEFAKDTKELVVKRGRRQMEMSARSLAVAKKEFEVFEQHTLADRERDLRQKVKDSEIELEKARLEHEKAMLELGVQQRQADERVKDLTRDVGEMQQKLAKLKDGK